MLSAAPEFGQRADMIAASPTAYGRAASSVGPDMKIERPAGRTLQQAIIVFWGFLELMASCGLVHKVSLYCCHAVRN
jgi:hypothetical protein